jgi:DMSO/TMAO reductase YedYZ molybdopterin-dependent catalytic subunit
MDPSSQTDSLSALPVHPLPDLPDVGGWSLTLQDGEISCTLDPAAVASLLHVDLEDSLTCLEGWTAGPLRWRGVPLDVLLECIGCEATASHLAVVAPDICAVLGFAGLPAGTILADSLDGAPLAREHGGPYRLVAPGAACFQSVKWVQRLELRTSAEGDTAQAHATRRLEGRRGWDQ